MIWRQPITGRSIVAAAVILFSVLTDAQTATAAIAAYAYDSKVIDDGRFTLYYSKEDKRIAEEVEREIGRCYREIADGVGLADPSEVEVYIASGREEFDALHHKMLPEWGEAFSDLGRNMIGINAESITRSSRPLKVVIRHELSHIFFSQKVGHVRCPAWFIEGLAMRQSREWTLADQWSLVRSLWNKSLPDLADLEGPFPKPALEASAAYRLSYSAVRQLLHERPEDLLTLISFIRDTGDFDRSFQLTFGERPEDFTEEFHLSLEKKYRKVGVLFHSTPFWTALTALFLLTYILKKARTLKKIRQWEEEE